MVSFVREKLVADRSLAEQNPADAGSDQNEEHLKRARYCNAILKMLSTRED